MLLQLAPDLLSIIPTFLPKQNSSENVEVDFNDGVKHGTHRASVIGLPDTFRTP